MTPSLFTESQILAVLKEVDAGRAFERSQRSWLVCMLSHIAALVPGAPSGRNAIRAWMMLVIGNPG